MRRGCMIALSFIIAALALARADNAPVYILSFDANPAGLDSGIEWVMLCNQGNAAADLEGWSFHPDSSGRDHPLHGFTIPAGQCRAHIHPSSWLRNKDETIVLRDAAGREIDRTPVTSDGDNDNRFWVRRGAPGAADPDWRFELQTLAKGQQRIGTVLRVVDGDTIYIGPVEAAGVQAVRLTGIDAPELDTPEGQALKTRMETLCLNRPVTLMVDDLRPYDQYNRILAVVLAGDLSLNRELQADERVQALIIMPSAFVPYAAFTSTPPHPAPGQEVVFDASSAYTLDPQARIISYDWTIGDTVIKGRQIVTHAFPEAGTYTVVLTVTDSDGKKRRQNTAVLTVAVSVQDESAGD